MSRPLERRRLAPAAVLAFALGACRSDELPDLDVNGYWSLNPVLSRYLAERHYMAFYIEYDGSVAMSTTFIRIQGLPSSREGGEADPSSFMRQFGSECPAGWQGGAQTEGEEYVPYTPGGRLRWTDPGSNLIYLQAGIDQYYTDPMTCSFPHADQMRCIWGWPGGLVDAPELRDEVLVFDRGAAALRPKPCEVVLEAALHFPYHVWVDR